MIETFTRESLNHDWRAEKERLHGVRKVFAQEEFVRKVDYDELKSCYARDLAELANEFKQVDRMTWVDATIRRLKKELEVKHD